MKVYLLIMACGFLFSVSYFSYDKISYYYDKWHFGSKQNQLRVELNTEPIRDSWTYGKISNKTLKYYLPHEIGSDYCKWFQIKIIDEKNNKILFEEDRYCDCCNIKDEYNAIVKTTDFKTKE